jgi:hypothetical protein
VGGQMQTGGGQPREGAGQTWLDMNEMQDAAGPWSEAVQSQSVEHSDSVVEHSDWVAERAAVVAGQSRSSLEARPSRRAWEGRPWTQWLVALSNM